MMEKQFSYETRCLFRYGIRFVTSGEFAVAICILSYEHQKNSPYFSLSQRTIAGDMDMSVQSVYKHIMKLEEKGLMLIIREEEESGRRYPTNRYDLTPLIAKCVESDNEEFPIV